MTRDHDDARLLTGLARQLHDEDSPEDTVGTVFQQAQMMLPSAHHISVTVRARRGTYRSIGSTSPLALEVDDLQYTMGEGPCIEVASDSSDGWFRSGRLGDDRRWPTWGPQAEAMGVWSLLSVQLLDQGQPFGAINMYSEDQGRFSDRDDIDLALLWAVHAATAIAAARKHEGLHVAITARHTIGVAQGILMERFDLDEHAAFRYLARVASAREQGVGAVAAEIIRTRRVPPIDGQPGG